MAAPSAAAEAVAALHLLLPRRRGLQGAEDDEEGWPGWLVALLCICGMCCMFAAIGKYRFEADGQRCRLPPSPPFPHPPCKPPHPQSD